MRRTLVLAMTGLVLGALVVAGLGVAVAADHGARTDAARELADDARRVAAEAPSLLEVRNPTLRTRLVRVVRATVGARFVLVEPTGTGRAAVVAGDLPPTVPASALALRSVLAGRIASGTSGRTVFAAVAVPDVPPASLNRLVGRGLGAAAVARALASAGSSATVVMVLTRPFAGAPLGGTYLLLVSAIALVVAATVAVGLSRRLTRPLVDAVAATGRIAAGDLSVRLTPDGSSPELDSLARSIDTMADRLAAARDQQRQFLLSVSHDLRTPLTSILGYAEAIAEGATDDPAAAAEVVTVEARRLERLVRDLLDLARLDARQFSLTLRPVALAPVLTAAAAAAQPVLAAAGLTLTTSIADGDELWATADPDRAAQVVANLLENAGKFAASAVLLHGATRPDGWVVVTVSDDGPGIPADEADRVFLRGYRSPRTPTRQVGTGLGLAIVAELTAAMGGTVAAVPADPTAAGQPGRLPGGCVVLALPPAAAPAAPRDHPEPPVP
jgi:two-component system sensor histidine kinase BaeS